MGTSIFVLLDILSLMLLTLFSGHFLSFGCVYRSISFKYLLGYDEHKYSLRSIVELINVQERKNTRNDLILLDNKNYLLLR